MIRSGKLEDQSIWSTTGARTLTRLGVHVLCFAYFISRTAGAWDVIGRRVSAMDQTSSGWVRLCYGERSSASWFRLTTGSPSCTDWSEFSTVFSSILNTCHLVTFFLFLLKFQIQTSVHCHTNKSCWLCVRRSTAIHVRIFLISLILIIHTF